MFEKSSGGKKAHISGIMRLESIGNELGSSGLPPLTDSSPYIGKTKPMNMTTESSYVPCFSNPIDVPRNQGGIFDSFENTLLGVPSNPQEILPRIPISGSIYSSQQPLEVPSSVYPVQDQSLLSALLEHHRSNLRSGFNFKPERDKMVSVSQETGLTSDMNPEISSVVSNFDMGRRDFENQQNPPASSAAAAAPVNLDSFWNY